MVSITLHIYQVCHLLNCLEVLLPWNVGIYGRHYYMKPANEGVRGTGVQMKETSPVRTENHA